MASRVLSKVPVRITRCSPAAPVSVRARHASLSSSVPRYLQEVPQTKISRLSNGIRVATEEWPGELSTVGVFVGTGSCYETDQTNGVAHFLEHLAFKGTKKRSQHKLDEQMENMGGNLNAYTSREHTVYSAKVFNKDVPESLDILADIIQNSSFDKDAVERERSVIIREMEETENNQEEAIFDYLHAAAYQGTALGRTILGPKENIESITRNNLLDYINNYYTAPNMVIAAAGGLKHEAIVAQAEKLFAGIPAQTSLHHPREVRAEFTGSEIRIRNDDMPHVYCAVAVEGLGWTHPDHFVLLVIQTMLGNWDKTSGGGAHLNSRLSEKIAKEESAECYNTFSTIYSNTSLFGNYIVAGPKTIDDSLHDCLDEWQHISHASIASEVERAKARLKAQILMMLDGTSAIADHIGRSMLTLGRVISPAETVLRIDDVTVDDVHRVGQAVLSDVSPALVVMGPIDAMVDYSYVRGWMRWKRL